MQVEERHFSFSNPICVWESGLRFCTVLLQIGPEEKHETYSLSLSLLIAPIFV